MIGKNGFDTAATMAWAAVITLTLGCSGQVPTPAPAAPSADRESNDGPTAEQPAAKDNAKAGPVITAEAFAQRFNENPQAFIRDHQGKEIEVSGTVQQYAYHSIDDLGDLWIDGMKFECQDRQPIAKALPGQTATLRGKCGEFGVSQWEVVKATGDPPPTFTTEELAKEITADAPGLAKRFSKGHLIVTGQIAKVEDDGSLIYLTPAGEEPEIKCTFVSSTPREKERNAGFQPGQQVRILAEMLSPTSLYMCDALPVAEE